MGISYSFRQLTNMVIFFLIFQDLGGQKAIIMFWRYFSK